ncbi:MAG: glycosyltransferase family 4 protein [Acidimicrobiales bacterium]|nr:glycosyltransferase family 4 protein [Acidimicrobiales bacterium]
MSGPTRVGVNLLWLVPGEVGGSEEYTVRLLRALADARPADLDVRLFVNGSFPSAHPDLVEAFPTTVAPVSGRHRPSRVLAESTWLAAAARRHHVDVVHHAGGTVPPIGGVPAVVTLHDLQPLTHPERFSLVKRAYLRTVVPGSLRRARVVVTLTDFTAGDAVERCGVRPDRIRRVPCGVDPVVEPADPAPVLGRHGLLGRRIVLYPAITYAHKNHETLVRAVATLVADRPDLVLVLTGGVGPAEELVAAAVDAYGIRDHVARLGRIPGEELDVLYGAARVLAFPSSYEGFGLPVLEAMAHGCPVVASLAGGLPWVTGGAALLVPPLDAPAWASALASVLDDDARHAALAAAGRGRAGDFPWSSSVEALVGAYRAAALPGEDAP